MTLDELILGYLEKLKIDKNGNSTTEGGEPYLLDSITARIRHDGLLWLIYPNDETLEESAENLKSLGIPPLRVRRKKAQRERNGIRELSVDELPFRLKPLRKNREKILVSAPLLSLQVASPRDAKGEEFTIRKGDEIDTEKLVGFLKGAGYVSTPSVSGTGEFTLRGETVEIFSPDEDRPARISLDWDEVAKIELFGLTDDDDRREEIESITLLRAADASGSGKKCDFSKCFSKDDGFVLYCADTIENAMESFDARQREAFSFLSENEGQVRAKYFELVKGRKGSVRIGSRPGTSYFGVFADFCSETKRLLETGWKVFVEAETLIQKERIRVMMSQSPECKGLDEKFKDSLFVEERKISGGFFIDGEKAAVLRDAEIFHSRRVAGHAVAARLESEPLESWTQLKGGDLVVHLDYGIGRFAAIERIRLDDSERDYIKIEFADKEFYYAPVEKANLIQKYIGRDTMALDSLHSGQWRRKKEKALENARKFAESLLKLYALRSHRKAFAFPKDTPWQKVFESGFEFAETEDQLAAIRDVKDDMESDSVTDRIICGDVGYGKTEVAFRAAFKAIMSGKQVCFLSPTTILTAQHCRNFRKRCGDFPVKVREFSRVVSQKEAEETKRELADGNADIVFATHRILQDGIAFKNLGLLIVDEEQRFGVRHKEKIKTLKTNVDTITLTATPIPRTLYMSLVKLRDISVLKTAPDGRLPVEVKVAPFSQKAVVEAIERELGRGGQVFYLHNDTSDINAVADFLKNIFPQAKVDCLHGKMKPEKIEDGIFDFANGCTDVLVSTTIIENGIDIPNANTLIVDDATIYGTSQLYQIKGRIGRSRRNAFAYLFWPQSKSVSHDAVQRVKVITENSALGSGFNIAMNDLMLRGAGNLLGKEQSGHMEEIGLDMYTRLIDLCIRNLEEGEQKELETDETYIKVNYTAFIPDGYIADTETKFKLYKTIANASSEEELSSVRAKVCDDYGPMPTPFAALISLSELKITMKRLGVPSIEEDGGICFVKFGKMRSVGVDAMLSLMKKHPKYVSLNGRHPDCLLINSRGIGDGDKIDFLLDKLKTLRKNSAVT